LVEATNAASLASFHIAIVIAASLLALGGLAGAALIENPTPDQRGGLAAG
jgi:hypothetical protein